MIDDRLNTLITVCGIISYLVVSIVVVGKILRSITEDYGLGWVTWMRRSYDAWKIGWHASMCVLVFVLLAIQFWGFFRLHSFQKDITTTAGGDFPDEQWTFGQIVAVVVYMPVVVEVVFIQRKRLLYCR
jgi:hypothetical protein